jgi:DNA-binding XRE family transcriptional regulator
LYGKGKREHKLQKTKGKNMTMGQKIKQLRESLGMSITTLSLQTGVAYFTIYHLERGTQKTTTHQNMLSLAEALDVSVETLIDESIDVGGEHDA